MTFNYTAIATKAQSLLTKFGRDVTLRRITAGTYDTQTSSASASTADTVFKGALFDFDKGVTEVNGELIQATDKRLLLEASAVPAMKDVILIGGVRYGIMSIGEINPAGTVVIYDLHLRK